VNAGREFVAWGDSLTYGWQREAVAWPFQVGRALELFVWQRGRNGETSTQVRARFEAEPDKLPASVAFWVGRNNASDPATILQDVEAMVQSLGHSRWVVLGMVNLAIEPTGSAGCDTCEELNGTMAGLYPGHFFDVRAELLSFPDGSEGDAQDVSAGIPPRSLRLDLVHFNGNGHGVIAQGILRDHAETLRADMRVDYASGSFPWVSMAS